MTTRIWPTYCLRMAPVFRGKRRRCLPLQHILVLVAMTALLGACGTSEAIKVPDQVVAQQIAPIHFPRELQPFHLSDDIVREFDMDGDSKPDFWKVYRPASSSPTDPNQVATDDKKPVILDRLVRKEIDLNHDGKPDVWRYYDDKGAVQMEAYDFDFDGHIDQVSFFEGNVVVKKGQDLNGDGESDQWTTFEKGKIVKRERDTNGDAQTDYWEYWEDGSVSRIGIDEDGDGLVDRWNKAPKKSAEY